MIALTGATGQLGRLVLAELLKQVPASSIVALVRDEAKAADLAACGVVVRVAPYEDAAALQAGLAGVEKLLLISASEVGKRIPQHRNVINAAKAAGVKLLVYTSLLRADTSQLSLAEEHIATEALIRESGLPFVLLRNGWYAENYAGSIPSALEHGAFVGSVGDAKLNLAARADYAAAAAVALTGDIEVGRTYELSGDEAITLADFAAELSRQTGREIPYADLPEAKYAAVLTQAGLPEGLAAAIAGWDAAAGQGALADDGTDLSTLIGRPTTPISVVISAALARN
ncbi:SDR family oxidoreductase [Actomonas aquatica]|uniref:SDR family oxidoreductase n=1 Tax=Actomonas aquatica TaxID=2866162 RepID=A0ABZ1C2M9_9BACT|nr:SDR family oxidoreductase [Opitutus sp. WL0086]WRQ85949.1 SDR family oxidoreductase [Opitutus sp. WL0086]